MKQTQITLVLHQFHATLIIHTIKKEVGLSNCWKRLTNSQYGESVRYIYIHT